jgi:hypothetical protein
MLFCGNVPYTLTCPLPDKPLALPEECALLIVPESLCLSNTECADIKALAAKGKTRVLILGDETGLYDENYRQRKENIFESEAEKNGISKNAGNFIFPLINGDFQMKIKIPDEINKTFFKLLGKVYAPELRIDAEFGICSFVRKNKKQFSVNLINYAPEGTPLKVSVKQKLSETKEYKIIYPFGGLENGIFQRRPDKSLNTNFKISDAASLIFDAR